MYQIFIALCVSFMEREKNMKKYKFQIFPSSPSLDSDSRHLHVSQSLALLNANRTEMENGI